MEAFSMGDVSQSSQSSIDIDEFGTCMTYIEDAAARYALGSEEEADFKEHVLLDHLRTFGAPVTLVKSLRNQYKGGPLNKYTDDLGEVIGLLIFVLKEDSCIPSSDIGARERLLSIANQALKMFDEKSSSKKSTIPSTVNEEMDDASEAEGRKRAESRSSEGSSESSESSEGDSSEESRSRKEMNRLIEAKQYIAIDKIASMLNSFDPVVKRRVERFVRMLNSVSIGNEDDSYLLAETYAPMFARPDNTAYMSIRHLRELPQIRLVLWVWIENYDDIAAQATLPYHTKSAAATPPPATRHLLAHAVKPRLSSVSSTGLPASPYQAPLNVHINSIGEKTGEDTGKTSPLIRHTRKKTPPRISELSSKRRVEMEHIDTCIAAAVEMLFLDIDGGVSGAAPRFDTWLLEESGQMPASSEVAQIEGFLAAGKRQWATKERVTIEKRVLKRRLLHWDKEFEQRYGRKPTKEDRTEMRNVFHAYGAVKSLLQLLDAQNSDPDTLLMAEKKALQVVLRLFEKDFEDRNGRRVEKAADISGRELEYNRYKELKDKLAQRGQAMSESTE